MSYRGIKLLREKNDNWSVWSSKVENRLRKVEHAWSWVEGAQKPESVGDREWEKAKYEALDIIQTHIAGSIETAVIGIKYPKEMWDKIKGMFQNRKGIETCIALMNLINCQMESDETASQYLGRFQAARAKCQEIGWNFGNKDDAFYGIFVANNLSEEYDAIKQVLVSKGENLKYDEAVDIIHGQGLSRSKQSEREKEETEIHSGLTVREERRCYKCKSKKHLIGSCPKLTDREKREYRKRAERIKRYKGKLHKLQKQPESESESESSDNACVAYGYNGYSSIDSDSD